MYLYFALPGLAFSSWIARTPTIRDTLEASTAQMGWIIFGLSSGSMVGLLCASQLIAKFGGRAMLLLGLIVCSTGLFVVGIGGSLIPYSLLVFFGLMIFGFGNGLTDVTMNVEATAIEHTVQKSVLTGYHAAFSLGTLAGALLGALAIWLDISVFAHVGITATLLFIGTVFLSRYIPSGTGKESKADADQPPMTAKERLEVWKDPRTVMIGIVVLGMAFAEGSANDWLPLIMVDGFNMSAENGSIILGVFLGAMTIGRLTGDGLLNRFGRVIMLRATVLSAVIGLSVMIFGHSGTTAVIGAVFWGLGAALGFPLALSAAGDDPRGLAVRVAAVSSAGYMAFLVGPPFLGFIGDEIGLVNALFFVLAAVIMAGLFSHAVKPIGVRQNISNDRPM
ncbi:MFS transporter [Bacillaceae bacterium SIJ1]|nr:MFS transporter [Litoribacterium kuwaitense]